MDNDQEQPSNESSEQPNNEQCEHSFISVSSLSEYEPSQAEIETTRMQLIAAFLLIQQQVQSKEVDQTNQQTQMINQEGLQEIGSPREALLHCDEVLETNHTEACSSTKADEENPPYTFWCIDCDTGTYYSTKPDSDYPLPLCLSDRCLKDFIVATAKRVSQQLEYIIEHTVRGGGNGKRERRRRYRKRKRDCKREWAEIQQQQRQHNQKEDHDFDSSDTDN